MTSARRPASQHWRSGSDEKVRRPLEYGLSACAASDVEIQCAKVVDAAGAIASDAELLAPERGIGGQNSAALPTRCAGLDASAISTQVRSLRCSRVVMLGPSNGCPGVAVRASQAFRGWRILAASRGRLTGRAQTGAVRGKEVQHHNVQPSASRLAAVTAGSRPHGRMRRRVRDADRKPRAPPAVGTARRRRAFSRVP